MNDSGLEAAATERSTAWWRVVGVDAWTVAAVTVLAYALSDVLHEGVGHGGTCAILGGHAVRVTTTFLDCSGLAGWPMRWVDAAGTLMNLVTGGLTILVVRRLKPGRPVSSYFLWLFGVESLLIGFGYLAFSPLGHFGDWYAFVGGLKAPWVWRVGLTAVGVAGYIWTMRVGMKLLVPFLGTAESARQSRGRLLTRGRYLVGGTLLFVAGLLNPIGWKLVFISAIAAGFCGPYGLFAMGRRFRPATEQIPDAPPTLERNVPLLVLGAVAALVFILVLGPGVRL